MTGSISCRTETQHLIWLWSLRLGHGSKGVVLCTYLKWKHFISADLNRPLLNTAHFTSVLNGHLETSATGMSWDDAEVILNCGADWDKLGVHSGPGELGGQLHT